MAIYQGSKSLLPPSAYKQAVTAGYTGSAEEFAKLLATLPTEEDRQKWNKPNVLYVPFSLTYDDEGNLTATTTADFQETLEAINQGKAVFAEAAVESTETVFLPIATSANGYIVFSGFSSNIMALVSIYWGALALEVYTDVLLTQDALSNADPYPAGTPSPGVSSVVARADHVHPKEVSDEDRASWDAKLDETDLEAITKEEIEEMWSPPVALKFSSPEPLF